MNKQEAIEAVGVAESATTTDCISRRDALKPFCVTSDGTRIPEVDCDNFPVEFSVQFIKRHLLSLPPVEPKPVCEDAVRKRLLKHGINDVREIKKMDKWDKQNAIKMLKSKMDGSVDTSYEWCETIRMAIQALQDDWIPVSERLPEEAEIVLGTFYYGDDEEYAVHETYLTNAKCLIWGHNPTNEVIAWKPLPKPYMDCEAKIDKE